MQLSFATGSRYYSIVIFAKAAISAVKLLARPLAYFGAKSAVPMNESSLSILRRPHGFVRQFSSEAISEVKEHPNDFTA